MLPVGFTVRLRDSLRRAEGGQVLVGGSPARVLRLSAAARDALADGTLRVTGAGSAALARRLLDGNLADPVLAVGSAPGTPVIQAPAELRGSTPPAVAPPAIAQTAVTLAEITVVVPVRDRADQLDRCLAALKGASVLVVDDASHAPDQVTRVAEQHGAAVLRLKVNSGPAGARNAGLARVRTPYVAFVDCDVRVRADQLTALAAHFADPTVALVAPRVRGMLPSASDRPAHADADPSAALAADVGRAVGAGSAATNLPATPPTGPARARARWFERYDQIAASLDLGPLGGLVRPGATVGWVPSACLLGRADVLETQGGFDAGWRVGEDVDLVWRLLAAGAQVRYEPAVVVGHEIRGTARGWAARSFVYGTSGAALAGRHGSHVAPAVLSGPAAVGAAALLQRRWWSVPVAAAAAAQAAAPMRRSLPLQRDATRVSASIAVRGVGWAVRQETGLLLRHWWPMSAVLAPFSRPVRRALLSAAAIDVATFAWDRRGEIHVKDLPTVAVARRVDDLAYGAGLWWGALKARDLRALLPRRPR